MINNKQSMTNPFLQDAESTHEYNNQIFVVDYYPHPNGGTWQCCDANHYFRTRAKTKDEAIRECHKKWDEYQEKNKTMKKRDSIEFLWDELKPFLPQSYTEEESIKILSILKQAKAMHKEEQSKFTIDYFNWLHNNQYKYNPKVKMYQKMMINETLFFTIEELMIEFNKTQ